MYLQQQQPYTHPTHSNNQFSMHTRLKVETEEEWKPEDASALVQTEYENWIAELEEEAQLCLDAKIKELEANIAKVGKKFNLDL